MPTLYEIARGYAKRLASHNSIKERQDELKTIFREIQGLVSLDSGARLTGSQKELLLRYLSEELKALGFTPGQFIAHEDTRPSLESIEEVAKSLSICNDEALDLISMMASRRKENK